MGVPEPVEPTPGDKPSENIADWLVGPEEGLAAEMERRRDSSLMARPALLRPAAPEDEPAPFKPDAPPEPERASLPALPLPAPPPAGPAKRIGAVTPDLGGTSDFERGPAMTWEPGPSSVPALGRGPAPAAAPEPMRDFPMDDAEERSRSRAADIEEAMAAAVAATRPHEVVPPEAFNVETVPMPWHVQLAHVARTDRRLQALVGVVLVVLTALAFWPRGDGPTSIGRIRHHSDHFDGANVTVEGKVGQVFPVGGGYAFYLIDNRDTMVVFTRSRVPVERRHVRISGTMSNGWLDGLPTVALFESADAKP